MYGGITAPILEPVGEAEVVLQSVNIEAVLENLLCEVTMQQIYRNLEKINIEAVYTFPLPLDAVLLNMTIKTRTRELQGVIIEKSAAEDKYENAVTDGDTAVMLEQIAPGLYTMNVGNLQSGEEVEISITYAELYKWRESSLRFFLPTTIAPRYGDPESVGIQPHQTPEYDLSADNPFAITLTVLGPLADAAFQSPSHQVQVSKQSDKTLVTLEKGKALMDRDFVLNILMESEEKSFALFDNDMDAYVALASFCPKFPDVTSKAPRCITIIVDCSGSMAGDSIVQARKALCRILELLGPEDTFNVICFGSTYKMLFPTPVKAISGNLKKAANLLETLDADMGGTEIGQAIAAVIQSKAPEEMSKEVLLITDGEVWEWEIMKPEVAESGFRFFTVGVGSSVSEAFVQSLAEVTGGACELVSPREDMAEKIVRHFKRISFPRAENVSIRWPDEPLKTLTPQVKTIYDGDTLHTFARFRKKPEGHVTLTAMLENGETFTQRVAIHETVCPEIETDIPGTIARTAAASELKSLTRSEKIAAVAVKYQLMSRHTNYLAIDIKAERDKAIDLPVLRKTPQMPAAGWGGIGTVFCGDDIPFADDMEMPGSSKASFLEEPTAIYYRSISEDELNRRQYDNFIDALNMLHSSIFKPSLELSTIRDLESYGLPEEMAGELIELSESGYDEYVIVVLFLYLLSRQKQFKNKMTRILRRIIDKAHKKLCEFPYEIADEIEKMILSNIVS